MSLGELIEDFHLKDEGKKDDDKEQQTVKPKEAKLEELTFNDSEID